MNKHVISEEAFDYIQASLSANKHWFAYNIQTYFLEKGDVVMFRTKEEAKEFAANNWSDADSFSVVPVSSMADVMRNIPYEQEPGSSLTDPDANGLFNKDGNAFTDALIVDIEQEQFIHSNKKTTVMNENNFKYLDDQIFYKNFGRVHSEELKEKMKEGKPEFMLTHQQDYGKDNTVATLHFKKSSESDMYFFNSYNLMLKVAGQQESIKQTFYINNDPKKREQEDVTLKEGYNLLSGRAVNKDLVNKEGVKYNAWVQLDFKANPDKHGNYEEKKYTKNYGFDLEQVLKQHPIKELADTKSKEQLMESLQRGNRRAVTLQRSGEEHKIFIEAAPRYKEKGLNFYDSNMKRLNLQELYAGKGERKQEGKQESKSASAKQDAGGDEEGDGGKPSKRTGKIKSQGQGIS